MSEKTCSGCGRVYVGIHVCVAPPRRDPTTVIKTAAIIYGTVRIVKAIINSGEKDES